MESSAQVGPAPASIPLHRRLTLRPTLVLCATLAGWAAVPLLALAAKTLLGDQSPTGAYGLVAIDQLQYLAWIREAGQHGLISNLFSIGTPHHVFFHPFFSVSGILWRLGVPLQLAYLVWVPITVAVLFYGITAYVQRLLPEGGSRWAAFALIIFMAPPLIRLLDTFDLGLNAEPLALLRAFGGELSAAGSLWAYLPKALSIGLLPLVFLAADRGVHAIGPRRTRLLVGAVAGAVLVSWCHPWQGITLVLVLTGILVWYRFDPRKRGLALVVAGAAAPLLYYFALSHTSDDWATASLNQWPSLGPAAWVVAFLGFSPLFALAALGVHRPRGMQEKILILWPLASACTILVPSAGWYYAPAGASIPLAILMVRGWGTLRERLHGSWVTGPVVAVSLIALITIPTVTNYAKVFHRQVKQNWFLYYMDPGEREALSYLEHSGEPGAVFPTPMYGAVVSSMTGRQSFSGHFSWTPNFIARENAARGIFTGQMGRRQAGAVLRRSGARFVLADCRFPPPVVERRLGDAVTPVRIFGCAGVYRINGAAGT